MTTYLTAEPIVGTVTALDQEGRPFLGDLGGVVVSSSSGAVVPVLGPWENGVASLTLTRSGDGDATVSVAAPGGAVTANADVRAYTPQLTSFSISL